MKRVILALVLLAAACEGRVDPQLVDNEAASDGGVVATSQAVTMPGYTINWNEDHVVSWNATFEHYIMMQMPGRSKLQYYFNSAHIGVQWEWSMDGGASWSLVTNVARSHAFNSTTSVKAVGSGYRGCWEAIGCVPIPAPMVDWTVYHHQTTWNSAWVPPGTDPVLPHPPVYLRKRYVVECMNGDTSRPFANGIAIRLDTAPAQLNIAYTSSAPASGVFIAPNTWASIAKDCLYGEDAFFQRTYCTNDTQSSTPYCFTWPPGP